MAKQVKKTQGASNAGKTQQVEEKTIAPAEVIEVKENNEETTVNESVENAEINEVVEPEQKKHVIAPAEVIEVKEKPVQKAAKGRVLVQGAHAPVEVSPATAKIISKFKK